MDQASEPSTSSRTFAASGVLLVVGVILPFAGWYAAQAYATYVAAQDPIPNQGAMVLALLGFGASCVLAVIILVLAVVLLVLGRATTRQCR